MKTEEGRLRAFVLNEPTMKLRRQWVLLVNAFEHVLIPMPQASTGCPNAAIIFAITTQREKREEIFIFLFLFIRFSCHGQQDYRREFIWAQKKLLKDFRIFSNIFSIYIFFFFHLGNWCSYNEIEKKRNQKISIRFNQ